MAKRALVIPLLLVITAAARGQSSSSVSFWKGSEAVAGGPLLLDRMNESSYQVYSVRRDKPGTVELHDLDTDVIFVLDGSATFVTGGSVTGRRTLRPNESTGTGISDGDSRRLGEGDVINVPNGTPHWFQDVHPTINYFAVKLRQEQGERPSPSSVMYWKGAEAFAKGGMLFDAKEGRFVRVYALRRNKPLGVELHGIDTDVVFVVNGAGTFVTDGSIQQLRTIGPAESTGISIDGGDPRQLGKGDVLVMPKGTPHWLRDVDGTIDFFAVKVR